MEESRHPESQASKRPAGRTLAIRLLVGVILVPLVLAVTYAGGLAFAVFVGLLAALGAYELLTMASGAGFRPGKMVGILGAAAVALSFHSHSQALPGVVYTVVVVVVLVDCLVRSRSSHERYLTDASVTALAAAYPAWFLGCFVWMRDLPFDFTRPAPSGSWEPGVALVYLVLILTWTYDSLAYLVGSAVGKHKLFPRISPSKTVEGAAGGLAGSVAAALVCRATFASFLSLAEALFLGVLLGAAAQIGDVAESMLKRSTGAKDSSSLIPGHGGFLDRFDSLLFSGLAFYLYVRIAWS